MKKGTPFQTRNVFGRFSTEVDIIIEMSENDFSVMQKGYCRELLELNHGKRALQLLDQLGIYGKHLGTLFVLCGGAVDTILFMLGWDLQLRGQSNFGITRKQIYHSLKKGEGLDPSDTIKAARKLYTDVESVNTQSGS